jgi:phosphopantothenoylcysteine decarboxylase / phosphopantothenate---cysteine ligase
VGEIDPCAATARLCVSGAHGLGGRAVALCVTGSVAAYKAVEVARFLVKSGVRVQPVMTVSAARFVGPVTLAGITGNRVAVDMWDPTFPGEAHVALADNADLVAIVPATADILSRLASGRADDLVTALALCARGPVLAAPAMHPRMWEHPATQRNVSDIAAQKRVTLVGPVVGDVASGDFGAGRMADPTDIVAAIAALLSPRDLVGLRVVVTAGPTLEDIDPVRFLGNHSSGKMGFAIAERAAARGASVTLVSGPVVLPTPYAVQRVDVRSATGMQGALWEALGPDLSRADALIMAAAVADYRPQEIRQDKMKKSGERISLELVKNPDLLAEVGARRAGKRPVLVGFALETQSGQALVESARRKLEEKRVDLVVANEANGTFGANDIAATIVNAGGAEAIPRTSKLSLADRVLDRVHALLQT